MEYKNKIYKTFDEQGEVNGSLVPIYNENENKYPIENGPKQVYSKLHGYERLTKQQNWF